MTAKKYLNQIRWLTIEIESRRETLLRIREETYGLTSGMNGPVVDTSGNSSKTERAAIKLQEAAERLEKTIIRREKLREKIEADIGKLTDPAERSVLILRYIELLSWDEIGERMNYARRTAQRIHGRALGSIERILKEEREK